MRLGGRGGHPHKDLGAVELLGQGVGAPLEGVHGPQLLHLLDVLDLEVVVGVAVLVAHARGQLGLRGGQRDGRAGGVAEAGEGDAARVVLGEEDVGRVEGRGLGRGRVVDDGVGGRERGGPRGEEGVVGGNLEGSLRASDGLVAAGRGH